MSGPFNNLFGPGKGVIRTAVPFDMARAEVDLAARMAEQVTPPKPKKRKRDAFPNGIRYGCGAYGMHRQKQTHAVSVQRCLRALRPIADTFDALYVTGLSGMLPASVAAYMLGKELLVLRKLDSHGSHMSHGMRLEGECQYVPGTRYVIIDDFVAQGNTLRRLLKGLPPSGKLVGVLLYGAPRGAEERKHGFAKQFATYDSMNNWSADWRLIRRSPQSMMFDLQCIAKQEANTNGSQA